MNVFVVDTNVAVAANGRDTHADERCQLTCIDRLERLMGNEVIAIDEGGSILEEYSRRLYWTGAPGVGDAFFKRLVDFQHRGDRILRVGVTPTDDDRRGFQELPENRFDRSDRKFLAVAVVARASVLNATDSDWREHGDLMVDLGIEVDELCPHILKGDGG